MTEKSVEVGPSNLAAGATPDDGDENTQRPNSWPLVFLVGACVVLTLLPPAPLNAFAYGGTSGIHVPDLDVKHIFDWLIGLRFGLAFVVSVPFILARAAAKEASDYATHKVSNYELNVAPRLHDGAVPSEEDERDQLRWVQTKNASEATWKYELSRFERGLDRVWTNARLFGAVSTFILAASVFALTLAHGAPRRTDLLVNLAPSMIAAASTAFLMRFGGIAVRISSVDISARMFAWAARSVILATIADLGLFFAIQRMDDTWTKWNVPLALLLGVFSGATGDHALDLLHRRAAKIFGAAASAEERPSELLKLEGITAKHVNRLEEEDILSIHDLAFVPTARLFFSTAYSLQQICNWQDRALLWVYVGPEGATSLGRQMKVMGAIDLLDCAHQVLHETSNPNNEAVKATLSTALTLDQGGLHALLRSMAHDQATRRVRLYWQGAVATTLKPTGDEHGRGGAGMDNTSGDDEIDAVVIAEQITLVGHESAV